MEGHQHSILETPEFIAVTQQQLYLIVVFYVLSSMVALFAILT